MKKQLTRFIIFSTSGLITKVIYDFLMLVLPIIHSTKNPYYDVLIGMGLTVLLFLPLYNFIFVYAEKAMAYYVKITKKTLDNEILSLSIAYLILLVLVLAALVKIKFGVNMFDDIKSLFIKHK
ncbi:MAG: hypothetical protein NW207_00775 [Cytophagales bacterium]|nr:hypothetical protein [Cytophagales bacterium]